MSAYYDQVVEAAEALRRVFGGRRPSVGLVLGSGLGDLADEAADAAAVSYAGVPHFPVSTVKGHAGRFVCGDLEGKTVLAMQGRFHYYEGYSMRQVVLPIYVMRELGVRTLILTNAAGGMNRSFRPGDLMLIADHINLTGDNPLAGPNDERLGERFPDMSAAYDPELRALARAAADRIVKAAEEAGDEALRLMEGVYCGIAGPSYMTPSELKMLAAVGGDAVGMSTVAEAIAARHAGLRLLGISCITDMAIGEELEPLTHEEVVAAANRAKPKFMRLVRAIVRELPLT